MVMIGSRAPIADPLEGPVALPGWVGSPAALQADTAQTGAQIAGARQPSFWDRLGAATGGKDSAGAWLRAGGALLNGGGIGDAISAGTGYVDRQRQMDAGRAQQGFDNNLALSKDALARFVAENNANVGLMGAVTQGNQVAETGRHNRASEGIEANGQRVQLHGIDTQAATARRGQDVSLTTNAADNATSRANNAATTGASIYGDNLGYLGRTNPAGIGSKNQGFTETTTTTKPTPAVNGWFSDTPAMPGVSVTTRSPATPATTAPAVPSSPAIAALRANPALKGQFEVKYGAGSAAQFLGGR